MAESLTGINPSALKWAREQMGLSPEDVAARLKRDAEKIIDWEKGKIISVREVSHELETHSKRSFLEEWIKQNKAIFRISNAKEMNFVKEIFQIDLSKEPVQSVRQRTNMGMYVKSVATHIRQLI